MKCYLNEKRKKKKRLLYHQLEELYLFIYFMKKIYYLDGIVGY